MRRNFQTLVVAHQLLIFATVAVQSALDTRIPPELLGLADAHNSLLDDPQGLDSRVGVMWVLWWAMMLVSLLASVGVLLFRPWGRGLFLSVSVVNVLLTPLVGFYVDVGWTVMVAALAGTSEGMIIALMYFSPVRRMFARGRARSSPPD